MTSKGFVELPVNAECQVIYEGETDLAKVEMMCTKNPGHLQFYSISDFNDHIPESLKTPQFLDYIGDMIEKTVKIVVKFTSPKRPDTYHNSNRPYPFHDLRGNKRVSRCGTGYILSNTGCLLRTDTPCPCHLCNKSGQPEMKYWVVVVYTSTHVVYNDSEAERTVCECFYDTPDRKGVKSIYGVGVKGNDETDGAELVCVTHDEELVERLKMDYKQVKRVQEQECAEPCELDDKDGEDANFDNNAAEYFQNRREPPNEAYDDVDSTDRYSQNGAAAAEEVGEENSNYNFDDLEDDLAIQQLMASYFRLKENNDESCAKDEASGCSPKISDVEIDETNVYLADDDFEVQQVLSSYFGMCENKDADSDNFETMTDEKARLSSKTTISSSDFLHPEEDGQRFEKQMSLSIASMEDSCKYETMKETEKSAVVAGETSIKENERDLRNKILDKVPGEKVTLDNDSGESGENDTVTSSEITKTDKLNTNRNENQGTQSNSSSEHNLFPSSNFLVSAGVGDEDEKIINTTNNNEIVENINDGNDDSEDEDIAIQQLMAFYFGLAKNDHEDCDEDDTGNRSPEISDHGQNSKTFYSGDPCNWIQDTLSSHHNLTDNNDEGTDDFTTVNAEEANVNNDKLAENFSDVQNQENSSLTGSFDHENEIEIREENDSEIDDWDLEETTLNPLDVSFQLTADNNTSIPASMAPLFVDKVLSLHGLPKIEKSLPGLPNPFSSDNLSLISHIAKFQNRKLNYEIIDEDMALSMYSAIIVSHPHGKSKKISIGTIRGYTVVEDEDISPGELTQFSMDTICLLPRAISDSVNPPDNTDTLQEDTSTQQNADVELPSGVICANPELLGDSYVPYQRPHLPPRLKYWTYLESGRAILNARCMKYMIPHDSEYQYEILWVPVRDAVSNATLKDIKDVYEAAQILEGSFKYHCYDVVKRFPPGTRFFLGDHEIFLPPEVEFYSDVMMEKYNTKCRGLSYMIYDTCTCQGSSGALVHVKSHGIFNAMFCNTHNGNVPSSKFNMSCRLSGAPWSDQKSNRAYLDEPVKTEKITIIDDDLHTSPL